MILPAGRYIVSPGFFIPVAAQVACCASVANLLKVGNTYYSCSPRLARKRSRHKIFRVPPQVFGRLKLLSEYGSLSLKGCTEECCQLEALIRAYVSPVQTGIFFSQLRCENWLATKGKRHEVEKCYAFSPCALVFVATFSFVN